MTVADILTGAADAIETRGHHKGWYVGPCGELCVAGAVYVAAGMEPQFERTPEGWPDYRADLDIAARKALLALSRHITATAVAWNDHPDRTQEEVVATLRAAAEHRKETR